MKRIRDNVLFAKKKKKNALKHKSPYLNHDWTQLPKKKKDSLTIIAMKIKVNANSFSIHFELIPKMNRALFCSRLSIII